MMDKHNELISEILLKSAKTTDILVDRVIELEKRVETLESVLVRVSALESASIINSLTKNKQKESS